ncbi:MAG TPA: LacI family transcriptional regulator [Candidatus Fournierella merdavium]|uniref:LacI family DNA-binding transcriptional regulator n=1 Tax=Candidatus Allofournierella merdavium TaxID=2838593 RepID=UPI001F91B7CE|nr:LacI family transcriptional regulator [Candidatus Fournierella merdavium]
MTIKDIARESGYAISTVSRALNDHPDVSEEAKRRIAAIVAEKGFVPNSNARQLKRQQAKSVAFIVRGTSNLFFAGMLVELQRLVGEAGYEGVVEYVGETADEVAAAQRVCRELKPRGIIFLGGDSRNFQAGFSNIDLPCVLATTVSDELHFPNLSMVGVDDRAAGAAAIDYLAARGHRDILVLGTDPERSSPGKMRLEGVRQGLAAHGIPFDPARFVQTEFSMDGGYAAMKAFLETGDRVTAVFAMSDVTAIGAARAILDAGLAIPGDISLLGFDGIPMARFYNPQLATMRQPAAEIARTSVRLLLQCVERRKPAATVLLQAAPAPGGSVRGITT